MEIRHPAPPRVRRRRAPLLLGILVASIWMTPLQARAQTGVVVEGRVFEEDGSTGIPSATVELEGHGVTLTSDDGSFRFTGVRPGGYPFRVAVVGYAPETRYLAIAEDVTLDVPLEIAPIPIDPLDVNVRLIEMEGEVRDEGRGFPVVNAEILTNLGTGSGTDSHGRFELERVPDDQPLQVSVRAFGYLPVDTVIVASEDERYRFELEPDPTVREMIDTQVARLEERVGGRWSATIHPLNRDELVRYAGSATLMDVLEAEYRFHLDRVMCIYVDEDLIPYRSEWRAAMSGLLPEEVERIDFMAYGARFQGIVLRVYTRDFMQHLVAHEEQVRRPTVQTILAPASGSPCFR